MMSAPSFSDGVEARLEARGQAAIVGQLHDVIDAVLARDLDGAVGRAVVDHEPLDLVDALDLAREVRQRARQGGLFVEAGDLDDELHARPGSVDARKNDYCQPLFTRDSQVFPLLACPVFSTPSNSEHPRP